MEPILVSACLLGANCKYSGGNNACPAVMALKEKYQLVPVCPEQLGGLSTPRPPAECQGQRVYNREGVDVTEQFVRGAEEALKLGQLFGCTKAVLKSKSPSCGCGEIYDGTFSGAKIPGDGVTVRLLKAHGYEVFPDTQLQNLLKNT